MRKALKILIWGFSLAFGTLFVASSILVLALLSGSIDLSEYTSYAEAGLQDFLPKSQLELESAHLSWDRETWSFSLHASDAKLKSSSQKDMYMIPKLHVSWPLLNILTFRFKPSVIELKNPNVKIRDYSLEGDDPEEEDLSSILHQIIEESPVEKIIISKAEVDFKTHTHGKWKLRDTDIVFKRDGSEVSGSFVAHLRHIGKLTGVLVTRKSKPLKLKVGFKEMNPKVILNHPYLKETPFVQKHKDHLSNLNTPLSGVLNFYFTPEFQIDRCKFHLDCEKGTLKYAPYIEDAFTLDSATLKGDILEDKIVLESIHLKSPLAELTFTGTIGMFPDLSAPNLIKVDIKGSAKGAKFSDADRLWPKIMGGTSREWVVKNIPKGDLIGSTLNLKMIYDVNKEQADLKDISGVLMIENASLKYMEGMPLIENMSAKVVYNKDVLTASISKGNTHSQKITAGKVKITKLQEEDQYIDIDLSLEGSAEDALRIIDVPRLKYAAKYGLSPNLVKGTAASQLKFNFPLELKTTLDQVDLTIETKIRDAFIPNIVKTPKVDLSNADLDLKLSKNQMTIEGTAKIHGADSKIDWWESYDESKETQATLKLTGSIGKDQLVKMGLNVGSYLTGSAPLTLSFTKKKGGHSDLKASLNMKPISITIPEFRTSHSAGEPGKLDLEMSLKNGSPERISDLTFTKGTSLKFSCSAEFVSQLGSVRTLTINRFTTSRDSYSGKIIRLSDGTYSILLSGSYIDLDSLIENKDDIDDSFLSTIPYKANIRFNKAEIKGKPFFKNLSAQLEQASAGYIKKLNLRTEIDNSTGKKEFCTLKIVTQGSTQNLDLHLDDLGTAIASFGAESDLKGGKTSIQASRQVSAKPSPWEGKFTVNNFVVLKAPILINLLKIVNPMSVLDIFSKGKGMSFQSLSGGFKLQDDLIQIRKSLAVGPSIGMTVEGNIYRKTKTLDLKGTVIPAYILNSMVSYIPIIGKILAGDAGEGMVAIPYTIKGPFASPQIKSQPLGAMTPGILRKMFDSPTPRR